MADIKINQAEVKSVISAAISLINESQAEVSANYGKLIGDFSESSGEEVNALRQLAKREQEMITVLNGTLEQFAKSVQFAASQLGELDSTGAKSMR